MFSVLRNSVVAKAGCMSFSTSRQNLAKVAVLGAAGGIGQPLSLLLMENPKVCHLALYDLVNCPGVAADLSHINTNTLVTGHDGPDELGAALTNSDIVVIPAGVPRKPGMTRDDLFNTNARIVQNLVAACAKHCPKAILAIISNPVNSTVPIASEVLKQANVYDPNKLFGVTTLDVVRSCRFVAELKGLDPDSVKVPVVGGHSGNTILPILSQVTPQVSFTQAEVDKLTPRIQEAGTEVVTAKAGQGSATLSMAVAAAKFTSALLNGLAGEPSVVCSYVESNVTSLPFFSNPVLLGPNGIERNLGLPPMNDHEKMLMQKMLPELESNIKKGLAFGK